MYLSDESVRVGLLWHTLGCRASHLRGPRRDPNLYPHLLLKVPRKPCVFESAGNSWSVLMGKRKEEHAVGGALRKPSPALHYRQGTGREWTGREKSVPLLFTLSSEVLQDNLENMKPFFPSWLLSLEYEYSPSSLLCRIWGFMPLWFFSLFYLSSSNIPNWIKLPFR